MTTASWERTGWRDARISERHQKWGWDCPAIDLDFLLIEYDKGQPSALVEYKHEKARYCDITEPSYQALIGLGTRAKLPVFVVRYTDDFSAWLVTPINSFAQHFLATSVIYNEREWVTFLYHIRGYEPPATLFTGDSVKV